MFVGAEANSENLVSVILDRNIEKRGRVVRDRPQGECHLQLQIYIYICVRINNWMKWFCYYQGFIFEKYYKVFNLCRINTLTQITKVCECELIISAGKLKKTKIQSATEIIGN